MPRAGGDELASVAEALAGLTTAARAGGLDVTAALTALAAARRIAAGLEHSELALIEAARDGGATWTRIAAAMGTRNRQTAQKRHAGLARRCPRPPSADTPAAQPGPQAPDARHDGSSLPEAKALVSEGALPKSTIQADDHARLPPAPARPATARRRPAIPGITGAVIAEGLYELVRAPGHAETRAWHVLAGGRLAGWSAPPGAGSAAGPAGSPSTCPGSRCQSRGPAGPPQPETPAPAMPLRSACCAPFSASRNKSAGRLPAERNARPRTTSANRGHLGSAGPRALRSRDPAPPGSRRTQGSIRPIQGEHPSVRYQVPSARLNSWKSRGLSNNGTASGDSGLKTAGLPPLAVRISQSVGGHQDLPAGGHEDGNGGYHRGVCGARARGWRGAPSRGSAPFP